MILQRKSILFLFLTIMTRSFLFAQSSDSVKTPIFGFYEPTANPELQLQDAIAEATKSHKNILLDIGGEWCKWCHYLDRFFEENGDVTEYLKENFVLMKVNFSKENENEKFLNSFPKVAGYPHFFVLDSNGKLLHSQDTGKLEKGQGHDRDKMLAFLKKWSPKNK